MRSISHLGQLLLRQAGLALDPNQDHPLCPRHAVRPRPFVGLDANQACDVVQQEQQVATGFIVAHARVRQADIGKRTAFTTVVIISCVMIRMPE
jgi:hypothetical protein